MWIIKVLIFKVFFFVFASMKAYKILPDDLFFLLFQFLEIRNLY